MRSSRICWEGLLRAPLQGVFSVVNRRCLDVQQLLPDPLCCQRPCSCSCIRCSLPWVQPRGAGVHPDSMRACCRSFRAEPTQVAGAEAPPASCHQRSASAAPPAAAGLSQG